MSGYQKTLTNWKEQARRSKSLKIQQMYEVCYKGIQKESKKCFLKIVVGDGDTFLKVVFRICIIRYYNNNRRLESV